MKRFVKGLLSLLLSLNMAGQYCLPVFAQEEPEQEESQEVNTQEEPAEEADDSSDEIVEKADDDPSVDEEDLSDDKSSEEYEKSYDEEPIEISNENTSLDMAKYLNSNHSAKFIDRVIIDEYAKDFYTYLEEQLDGALIDPEKAEHVQETANVNGVQTDFDFYGFRVESSKNFETLDDANKYYEEQGQEITNQLMIAYYAFKCDHPEAFWIAGTFISQIFGSYSYITSGSSVYFTMNVKVYVKFKDDDYDIRRTNYQDISKLQEQIANRDQAIKNILAGMNVTNIYKKIEYLNDWLTANCEYNTTEDLNTLKGSDAHECISALYGWRGDKGPVCEGYAKAFKVLCDQAGIPCIIETGEAVPSSLKPESHAWNAVQINGNWYGIDPTWNDPTVNEKDTTGTHDYFLVGSQTLDKKGYTFDQSHPVSNVVSDDGTIYFNNGPILATDEFDPEIKFEYTVSFTDTEGKEISGAESVKVQVAANVSSVEKTIFNYLENGGYIPTDYVLSNVVFLSGTSYNAILRQGYMSTVEITYKNCSNETIKTVQGIKLKVYTDKTSNEYYSYDGSVDLNGKDYDDYEVFFGYKQVENPKDDQDPWTVTKYCLNGKDTLKNIFNVTYKDEEENTTVATQDLSVQLPDTLNSSSDVWNAIRDAMETTEPIKGYIYVSYALEKLSVNLYKLKDGETYNDANAVIDYTTSDESVKETINSIPIIVVNDNDGNLVRYTVKNYTTENNYDNYDYATNFGLDKKEDGTYAIHEYRLNDGSSLDVDVNFVDESGKKVGTSTCNLSITKNGDMEEVIKDAISKLEAPEDYKNVGTYVQNGTGYDVNVREKDHMEGSTLTLDGSIGVNIYMYLTSETVATSDVKMVFSQSGKEDTSVDLDVTNTKEENNKICYVFTYRVSAKELTDTIRASLYVGDTVDYKTEYKVDDYIHTIVDNADNYEVKDVNIAKALATYGDRVQLYFGYNTNNLPADTEQLAISDISIDDTYNYSLINNDDSLSFVGARMVLTSRPGLKLYFIGDTQITDSDVKDITENVETVSIDTEGKYQVVTISNIYDMKNMYTIKVGDNFSLMYSLYSYGSIALKGSNKELKELVQAMVLFNDAVNSYSK